MGYYHRWEDFPEKEVYYLPGMEIKARIMSSERIMLTDINAKKGVKIRMHHHEPEQIVLVYKGAIRVRTGKEEPGLSAQGISGLSPQIALMQLSTSRIHWV